LTLFILKIDNSVSSQKGRRKMKKFVVFLNLTAITTFFVLLFSTGAYADCTKDIDCKGNRICEKGICVDPGQTKPSPEFIAGKKRNKERESVQNLAGTWRDSSGWYRYTITVNENTIEIVQTSGWMNNHWEVMGHNWYWRGTVADKVITGKWIGSYSQFLNNFSGERNMTGTISQDENNIHLDYTGVHPNGSSAQGYALGWVEQNEQLDLNREK
jgi:hypothetical protein